MGIAAEFGRYGAKLVNVQWAVSALMDDQLVVSLWQHRIRTQPGGRWIYRDHLSRWSGNGNKLFGEHLHAAKARDLPIRVVKAITDNPALIEGGGDGSKARNTFKAHPERIGRLVEFDGDAFVIEFELPAEPHTP